MGVGGFTNRLRRSVVGTRAGRTAAMQNLGPMRERSGLRQARAACPYRLSGPTVWMVVLATVMGVVAFVR